MLSWVGWRMLQPTATSFASAMIDLIPSDDRRCVMESSAARTTKEAMLDVARLQIEATIDRDEFCHTLDVSSIAFAAVLNAFESVASATDLPCRSAVQAAAGEAIQANDAVMRSLLPLVGTSERQRTRRRRLRR